MDLCLKERIFVVKCFYQNQNSVEFVLNEFINEFLTAVAPTEHDVQNLVRNFEEFGNVDRILSLNRTDEEIKTEHFDVVKSTDEDFFSHSTAFAQVIVEEDYDNKEDDSIDNEIFLQSIKEEDSPEQSKGETSDDEYIPLQEIKKKLRKQTKPKQPPRVATKPTVAKTEETDDDDDGVADETNADELNMKAEPVDIKDNKIVLAKGAKTCPICNRTFSRSTRLKSHVRSHENRCEICGHHYRDYHKHMAKHGGEKMIQCSICGNKFRDMSRLKNHLVSHSDARPFGCDLCDKTFKSKDRLTCHKRIHSTERPVKCEICGKGFLANSDLRKHARTHTGEKPFICSYCGKSFASSNSLIVHNRTHTGEKPYKCEICGKDFSVSSVLVMHRRIHTGERPYKCKYCGKEFYDSGTCRSHERTHTGDYPYKCHLCGKAHNHPSNLKSHMRHAHKELSGDLVRTMEQFETS